MIVSPLTIGLSVFLLAAGPSPEPSPPPGGEGSGVRTVLVEGVAASGQAAPISVLREIGERVRGRPFSIMYGQYVSFVDDPAAPPLITDQTRVVSVERLRTGLFKAVTEVEIPVEAEDRLDRLRERIQRGAGSPDSAGSLILAREEAREDALEKGILAAVADQYPGDSAPARLVGRVYFLGTIREEVEEGSYVILARIKVRVVRP